MALPFEEGTVVLSQIDDLTDVLSDVDYSYPLVTPEQKESGAGATKPKSGPTNDEVQEKVWKVKSLFYQEFLRLQEEAERLNMSSIEYKSNYIRRRDERIEFYEKKMKEIEEKTKQEVKEQGIAFPLTKEYQPDHLEKYKSRTQETRTKQKGDYEEILIRVKEKRKKMMESRDLLEKETGICQKSDLAFREDQELVRLVCQVASDSVVLVHSIVEKCRLLQSKLIELCEDCTWLGGAMLDDQEQDALMQAVMQAAQESKSLMAGSKPIEHVKEHSCRSFVLSSIELVGVVAQYIRVLSVVLFKGGQSQSVIDDCTKYYTMVQSLLKNALISSKELLEKYEIDHETPASGVKKKGNLRIRSERYDLIQTGREQNTLERLLIRQNLPLPIAICMTIDVPDFDKLANALVTLFSAHRYILNLIQKLISSEVHTPTTSSGTLLRSNSMASKVMTVYSNKIGRAFLKRTLGPVVDNILEADEVIVLDPSKVKKVEVWKQHVKTFTSLCQCVLGAIINSVEDCPMHIRAICACLKKEVMPRFPQNSFSCIGGFLFLRFFCPAITSPTRCGVTKQKPTRDSLRTLVSIAKVLQNLANGTKFGEAKGGYYSTMNPFLEKNTPILERYFDEMCQPLSESQIQKGSEEVGPSEEELREANTLLSNIVRKEEVGIKNNITHVGGLDARMSQRLINDVEAFISFDGPEQ